MFCASFCTVAVKLCVWLIISVCACGATLTVSWPSGTAMVIAADADFFGSATELAVRTTAAAAGIPDGAVYVIGDPEALVLAESVPHALALQFESDQFTPLL